MKANKKHILKDNDHADVSIVGAIVGVLVVIVIGLLVYTEISGSISISSATGQTAHANVNSTASTVFTLAPIVAIVLIASVILATVTNFGGSGRGGL